MAWHPFRNIGLKVMATGLGTLLWMTVGSDQMIERSVRVPLVFRAVPPSLEIAPGAPDSVEVHLRGRRSQLTGDPGDVSLTLNLEEAEPGSRLFHLRLDQVTTPFGVQVTQVFPASVMLTLEETGERRVPIRPTVDGDPAEGFVIQEVTVEPKDVLVVGPMRDLESLEYAITETVSVEGATANVTRMVNVGVADAALRLREARSARVTVVIVKIGAGG
jgi:YbbR domain-containing protein